MKRIDDVWIAISGENFELIASVSEFNDPTDWNLGKIHPLTGEITWNDDVPQDVIFSQHVKEMLSRFYESHLFPAHRHDEAVENLSYFLMQQPDCVISIEVYVPDDTVGPRCIIKTKTSVRVEGHYILDNKYIAFGAENTDDCNIFDITKTPVETIVNEFLKYVESVAGTPEYMLMIDD